MPAKNHKALHTYTKESRKEEKQLEREGEWKHTIEKSKPNLETRNNFLSPQSIHRENTIQTWSSKHGEKESHQRREQG